ncbi:PLDc N-terminal domain-containing protein [Microbacterium azadirachtae]|uniref:PLDc N-terminal domain-containing protein n=1 Tax=Microbacterium azadirachtae TaxID=582680 RepID=UPI000891A138|nr:PLDc N-terminal domain-containing protein [Microbacterium azadirachtae]SDM45335.1 Phospholipase_D-nuclease N-terminal [Microbacterium azadirachtae]SEG56122.1 Phospholipase_D-nuclease N-terminal [Microbacterium azadirachtae]SEG58918.1 Phospholipase_D-nuclease N-terminal [Microbacterium azadirachtae]
MARFLVIGGFLAAVFWVFSIVDCVVQPASRHRGVSKGVWIAIVVVIPVIGGVLWFAIGRTRRGHSAADERYLPLDDGDPSHANAGSVRRISEAEQERLIKELQEELARLDERGDTDSPGPRP